MNTNPVRVQLSRKKGWRKPESTVVVSRPAKWGNPWRVGDKGVPDRATAVALFRVIAREFAAEARTELAGKNLACWCPLDEPCHADVLLEIANGVSL